MIIHNCNWTCRNVVQEIEFKFNLQLVQHGKLYMPYIQLYLCLDKLTILSHLGYLVLCM